MEKARIPINVFLRLAQFIAFSGAWIIHPMLTLAAKILIDVIPGVSQEASWTIVNLGYLLVGYLLSAILPNVPNVPQRSPT